MGQPDIPQNAGTHNAWIGHAAAGGYDLRSEFTRIAYLVVATSSDHEQAIP
jgi:hypothetical protein